jgi:hypothetical protein
MKYLFGLLLCCVTLTTCSFSEKGSNESGSFDLPEASGEPLAPGSYWFEFQYDDGAALIKDTLRGYSGWVGIAGRTTLSDDDAYVFLGSKGGKYYRNTFNITYKGESHSGTYSLETETDRYDPKARLNAIYYRVTSSLSDGQYLIRAGELEIVSSSDCLRGSFHFDLYENSGTRMPAAVRGRFCAVKDSSLLDNGFVDR